MLCGQGGGCGLEHPDHRLICPCYGAPRPGPRVEFLAGSAGGTEEPVVGHVDAQRIHVSLIEGSPTVLTTQICRPGLVFLRFRQSSWRLVVDLSRSLERGADARTSVPVGSVPDREDHPEGSSSRIAVLYPCLSAMCLGDLVHEVQTEAESRVGMAMLGIAVSEPVEDGPLQHVRYSRSVIFDDQQSPVGMRFDPDPDVGADRGVFDGVVEQSPQRHLESISVSEHHGLFWQVEVDGCLVGMVQVPVVGGYFTNER